MEFVRRNINKKLRNGEIIAVNVSSTSYKSSNGGGGFNSSNGGDYLPAIKNSDGTYTVNLAEVTFIGNVIAQGEVAAHQSGTSEATSGTAITVYDGLDSNSAYIALSANQGRVLKDLIETMGNGTSINIIIDEDSLSDNQILVYNATTKQWENKNNEGISEISKLKDVSLTSLSDKQILQYDATSSKWINKDFNTEVSALTEHINDTVKHITEAERTFWNNKLDKSVWDSAFYFDSSGNIRVKLNLIGDNEISAYGSGTSTSSGAITIVDNLNSTLTDAALSANQGRVLKDLIDTANLGDLDLSGYSKTSHTHSNYATTTNFNSHSGNTTLHITAAERTAWNGKADAHTHPYLSLSSTTTQTVSCNAAGVVNFNSTSGDTGIRLYNKNTNKGGVWWGSTTGVYLYNTPSTKYIGVKDDGTPYYYDTAYRTLMHSGNSGHTHSTLTFSAGAFGAKTYNGGSAVTVSVPTHTSHITNNSGYITTAATVTNADKLDGYHGSSANTASNYVLRGSSGQINVGAISAAGNITATGEVTAHSDRRLKSNIQPLENKGYVQPYTYIKDGKESIGFIAQEMQELYPQLVTVDESTEEKYLTVNYMQYTAVLQAQIIDLKKEIEELKEIIKNK